VLVAGRPALYVERGGRTLLTFREAHDWGDQEADSVLAMAAEALVAAVHAGRVAPLDVTRVNGIPALAAEDAARAVVEVLTGSGFTPTPRGIRVRG
jgi:ATP-dependent Lhr-like helicase